MTLLNEWPELWPLSRKFLLPMRAIWAMEILATWIIFVTFRQVLLLVGGCHVGHEKLLLPYGQPCQQDRQQDQDRFRACSSCHLRYAAVPNVPSVASRRRSIRDAVSCLRVGLLQLSANPEARKNCSSTRRSAAFKNFAMISWLSSHSLSLPFGLTTTTTTWAEPPVRPARNL